MQVSLLIAQISTPGGTGLPRRRFLLHLLRKVFQALILAGREIFVSFLLENQTFVRSVVSAEAIFQERICL